MRLDLTLLSLSLVVATPLAYAQTKPAPKADATVASYVARGAA